MLPGVFALLSDDTPVFGLVVIGGHAVVGIHPVGRRQAVGREAPEGEGRIVQLGGVGGGLCHLPDVGLRLVAEAALGQTKRPLGRDIAGADELPEFLCDLCRCRGCDEVERIVRLCRGEAEGVVAGIADTTKPAFSAEQAARGLFGQGKMVYNKYILGIKGRTIMYQKGIKRLLDVVLSACGLLVLSPLLLLLCLAIDGAFGGGDIKLMAAAGLFLGWQNTLLAMFLGILGGGLYGIWLLAAKKADKKDHFAFGPFLCAGIVIAMLLGEPILQWYCAFL